MLCQFSFSNYKSFKEEALLDMFAESISEHRDSLIEGEDGRKFLPVAVLYGPNGGGKSTVLEALNFLKAFVTNRVLTSLWDQSELKENQGKLMKMMTDADFKEKYHKFDPQYKDKPSCFDILFGIKEGQYRYQLSILHNQIVEENLYVKRTGEKTAEIVFERSGGDVVLGEELAGLSVEKVKESMPFLSHFAINYDIEVIDNAVLWFFNMTMLDYDNPLKEQQIILPEDEKMQKAFFQMLQEMGINIDGMRLEKDADGKIIHIFTKHILADGMVAEIPYEEESGGTRKLLGCLSEIVDCLMNGKLLIADELDAKLHPKLLYYIIHLFTSADSNRKGAQLLLTSQDMTTMTPKVYRRDEIWFCALDPYNASLLYSLVDFKKENGKQTRKDEAYGKRYMEGRYGADPYLRRILNWEELY